MRSHAFTGALLEVYGLLNAKTYDALENFSYIQPKTNSHSNPFCQAFAEDLRTYFISTNEIITILKFKVDWSIMMEEI